MRKINITLISIIVMLTFVGCSKDVQVNYKKDGKWETKTIPVKVETVSPWGKTREGEVNPTGVYNIDGVSYNTQAQGTLKYNVGDNRTVTINQIISAYNSSGAIHLE